MSTSPRILLLFGPSTSPAPPPPVQCFLSIHTESGGGILSLKSGGDLAIHCQAQQYYLVDINSNQYVDINGNTYIEIQS